MKRAIYFTILILVQLSCFAQNVTISGYVEDGETGEKLIGANIFDAISKKGAASNNYGFYSLTIPKSDSARFVISYIGYISVTKSFTANTNSEINFILRSGNVLEEITISGIKETPIEKRNEMSMVSIPVQQIKTLPSIGGESDIMKAMQLMPGVQSGNEGTSGLYVRGGSPDQNLVLLDDVPLYYVNHLGGFVSTFNTDAISNVNLTKGGFPAHYGNRLSSIMDIRMKEGNMKEFHGSGMIGMVASKLSVEGPIIEGKTSYIISYRRFLYDLLTRPLSYSATGGTSLGYNFYDLNAKINHKLSDKDRLFLSFYSGDDRFAARIRDSFKNDKDYTKAGIRWGNNLAALRWNHLYNPKLFSNVTLTYTRYRFLTEIINKQFYNNIEEEAYMGYKSGIYDVNGKIDLEYYTSPNYKVKFGANTIFHTFKPGITSFKIEESNSTSVDTTIGNYDLYSFENAIYVENEIKIGANLNSNIGARVSSYNVNKKNFYSFEPRILLNYALTEKLSLKTSYAIMQQNVHLLTSSGQDLPIDLWLPATDKVRPARSQQVAFGIARSLKKGLLEFSAEGYYKNMHDLITYKEGASYLGGSSNWENKVETDGYGESYGAEFLLQKKVGKTTGWIAYTISKTTRQFENINFGKPYPYKYDRRHDISIVCSHKISDKIDISATWVYGTGNAFTLATGKYNTVMEYNIFDQGTHNLESFENYMEVEQYESKNNYRMRAYHKLDVGINFHKKKRWGERTWNISIYNLYNRQNPYFYYFDRSKGQYDSMGYLIPGSNRIILKQRSLFPIIPSISYSFKF